MTYQPIPIGVRYLTAKDPFIKAYELKYQQETAQIIDEAKEVLRTYIRDKELYELGIKLYRYNRRSVINSIPRTTLIPIVNPLDTAEDKYITRSHQFYTKYGRLPLGIANLLI